MTPAERKQQFAENGECPGQWADQNGYPRDLVYRILNGRTPALRGKSFKAARALGVKPVPKAQ